jgi:hypothetical protein
MADTAGKNILPAIVYVMGTGRSGTTILEILLANNPGVLGVGEVTHIFRDGFIKNVRCGCGALTRDCRIWSEIRHQCGWTNDDDERLATLFRRYAWHGRFPWLALGLDSRKERDAFLESNSRLFNAVRNVSGAEVVIDSSKYAGRALALARAFPHHVRIICVTRSPAGLIRAFHKPATDEQLPKTLPALSAYYAYVTLCLRIVTLLLGKRVLHVRYDDLAGKPVETLERIGTFLQRDLTAVIHKVAHNEWLNIGHIVTGNRIRHEGRVRFRAAAPEKGLVKRRERVAAWLLNGYRRILGI